MDCSLFCILKSVEIIRIYKGIIARERNLLFRSWCIALCHERVFVEFQDFCLVPEIEFARAPKRVDRLAPFRI